MNGKPLWEPCVQHRGIEALEFSKEYFSQEDRRVLLIGGAGFDPRSLFVSEQLSGICGERLSGLFIREQRPNASTELHSIADQNDEKIRGLIDSVEIFPVQVFGIDNAPIGGMRATQLLHERVKLCGYTDLILDGSALSTGLMFPLARYCLEASRKCGTDFNFHLMVVDDPATDASIRSTSCGKASALHTFGGGLTLDKLNDAAKLWLPQLGTGRREFLNLIYQEVQPHAVCPILPFPSSTPRTGDDLIEEYGDLFDSLSDPMTVAWNVDSRDIVYAHEKNPLDLYRAVLRIADARHRVFAHSGGSQLILSPLGSKAVAIGLLLAALERGFAVVSVETIEYHINGAHNPTIESAELVHLWLHGQAYRTEGRDKDAKQ